MRRRLGTPLLVGAIALGLPAGTVAEVAPARPRLIVSESVPADLRTLAAATWERFTGAFPSRWGCVEAVRVVGAWKLPDRATYDPERRLVTVRVPGTAPNLQATLLHEFAHHLEFTCPEHRDLRPAFLAAQELSTSSPWFAGATWEATPSEQFAEATVELVLGRRHAHARVHVSPAALEAIRRWARSG